MNGELAQCVVVTSFANAYLHAPSPRAIAASLDAHAAFQHVKTIQFGKAKPDVGPAAFCKWASSLKRRHAKRLSLIQFAPRGIPDPNLEAFANGNPRGILVERDEDSELWIPEWRVTRGSKWLVHYTMVSTETHRLKPSVRSSMGYLRTTLKNATKFSLSAELNNWAELFDNAIVQLKTGEDTFGYLPTFGYARDARRLIVGAASAWVFGGMGSWNDIGFSDEKLQRKYIAATRDLYNAVCGGIIAATNAFDPTRKST